MLSSEEIVEKHQRGVLEDFMIIMNMDNNTVIDILIDTIETQEDCIENLKERMWMSDEDYDSEYGNY